QLLCLDPYHLVSGHSFAGPGFSFCHSILLVPPTCIHIVGPPTGLAAASCWGPPCPRVEHVVYRALHLAVIYRLGPLGGTAMGRDHRRADHKGHSARKPDSTDFIGCFPHALGNRRFSSQTSKWLATRGCFFLFCFFQPELAGTQFRSF
uniref:Uncharacterized protein n=1 Tax=Podarcis muralis TaxID=64176 RepID=A0A670KHB7_PODMU